MRDDSCRLGSEVNMERRADIPRANSRHATNAPAKLAAARSMAAHQGVPCATAPLARNAITTPMRSASGSATTRKPRTRDSGLS
jgi:hypothetical protein